MLIDAGTKASVEQTAGARTGHSPEQKGEQSLFQLLACVVFPLTSDKISV
jgi:nitrate reductase NapE component